jgi:2-polyprenyl-3-methyl-5-hydroxy-6-metoxy-1,4-benzoquinol methylase
MNYPNSNNDTPKAQYYASVYDPEADFDRYYTLATAKRIKPYLKQGDSVLELGSATSLMTAQLIDSGVSIDCVERSSQYLALAQQRQLPNTVCFIQSEIDSFQPEKQYDHILLTGLIHELDDPTPLLRQLSTWLKHGGYFHVSWPNPESIHKQVAQIAGRIQSLKQKSERAQRFLTAASYTKTELFELIQASSPLLLEYYTGVLFKPLSNAQMALLEEDYIWAFDELADHYPDVSAMLYAVFKHS